MLQNHGGSLVALSFDESGSMDEAFTSSDHFTGWSAIAGPPGGLAPSLNGLAAVLDADGGIEVFGTVRNGSTTTIWRDMSGLSGMAVAVPGLTAG